MIIDDKMKDCDLCGNSGNNDKCKVCGRNHKYGDLFVLDPKVEAYITKICLKKSEDK